MEITFTDLRTEGGHRVSAKRENNATTWFRVVAGKDGEVRLRDNFGGRTLKWNRSVAKVGENFVAMLQKGETLEALLPKPADIPPAPSNLAKPVVLTKSNGIRSNTLPLRIGAASDGSNRFKGDIACVVVAAKALSEDEIARLAEPKLVAGDLLVVTIQTPLAVGALSELGGKAYHLDGNGYLEIPSAVAPNGEKGLTLAAWIRPAEFPAAGMRIIDKCPVAAVQGYLLDTYPKDSLRLITREPHFIFPAKLAVGKWTHVAATVDGKTGLQRLYLNGTVIGSN